MPPTRTPALILLLSLGMGACHETTCEDACEDEHDDCTSEPPNPEQPLSCDRQYTHCLAVCTGRPDDEEPFED